MIRRTYRHLYLSTLRYDFRCRDIEDLMNKVPVSVLNEDPYSEALYGFSRLGQSRTDGLAVMHRVLVAAPGHPKTLHVLLHGVWLGTFLPGRAPMLLMLVGLLPRADSTIRSHCSAWPRPGAPWATIPRPSPPSTTPWSCWRPANWQSTPTWYANASSSPPHTT
ncbi:hypothetical protein NKH18_48035 [Streptomyces sp. M10(2022)]